MTAKRKRGELACYGYLKDPQDKTRPIVAPKTVDTVRNIFRWHIAGQTITTILENPTYLGHLTQNKRSQVSYKNSKRMKIDKATGSSWKTPMNRL